MPTMRGISTLKRHRFFSAPQFGVLLTFVGLSAPGLAQVDPPVAQAAGSAPLADSPAPSAFQMSTSGSLRAAVASSDRRLNDRSPVAPLSASVRSQLRLNSGLRLAFDGQLGNREQAGDAPLGVMRELYADFSADELTVTLGRQKIVWGRADALNPTDYFGARNYTRIVAEDDDQRLGVDALRLRYGIGPGAFEVVVEPRSRSTTIPTRERPGVFIDHGVKGVRHRSWALRYGVEGAGIDGAITYYDGYDRLPDITPLGVSGGALRLAELNPRIRSLGLDFATSAAGLVWRGEVAYMRTDDRDGSALFLRNRQLFTVGGVERTFAGELGVYAQLFAKRVFDYRPPASLPDPRLAAVAAFGMAVVDQASEDRHGLTLKVTKKWSDTWGAELSVVVAWPQHDTIVRSQVSYRSERNYRVVLGVDVFRGPATSTFGQLRDNSGVTLGVEHFF